MKDYTKAGRACNEMRADSLLTSRLGVRQPEIALLWGSLCYAMLCSSLEACLERVRHSRVI